MKLQTAVILVITLLLLIPCGVFLVDPRNLEVLNGRLHFFSWSAPIVFVGAWALIAAAALPTLYFTNVYRRLLGHVRGLEKERKLQRRLNDRLAHGDYEGVLKLLKNREDAHMARAKAHLGMGDTALALPILREYYEASADPEAGYMLVNLLHGEERTRILESLVKAEPKRAARAKAVQAEDAAALESGNEF